MSSTPSAVVSDHSSASGPPSIPGKRVGEVERGRVFHLSKRVFDLVVTSALLLILSPLLLAIAVAIVIETGRPAIFSQQRVGARRRRHIGRSDEWVWELSLFRFYKFRSMVVDADPALHQAHIESFVQGHAEPDHGSFKLQDDPRVTRVGRVIRATSLDELPQLFNVLKGDMSLVGPRPLPAYEVELYEDAHFERFRAPSGVTGLWQVAGRAELPFTQMIELDLEYVRTQSLARDLWILLRTLPVVVAQRGAG